MVCFIVDEENNLVVDLAIMKFMNVELKDNELWINNAIHFPTENILEIKIKNG